MLHCTAVHVLSMAALAAPGNKTHLQLQYGWLPIWAVHQLQPLQFTEVFHPVGELYHITRPAAAGCSSSCIKYCSRINMTKGGLVTPTFGSGHKSFMILPENPCCHCRRQTVVQPVALEAQSHRDPGQAVWAGAVL